MNTLAARALLAFVALPGLVAYVVPLLLVDRGRSVNRAGLILLAAGTILLLWCVREFYTVGKGTLAPWAPPERLVVSGLYRYSRNPMYVAVAVVLIGWAVTFRSLAMTIYAVAVIVAFHLRVVLAEEPWLARTHGEDWVRYKSRVRRWF